MEHRQGRPATRQPPLLGSYSAQALCLARNKEMNKSLLLEADGHMKKVVI